MSLPRPHFATTTVLMWLGLLGAPFAWTIQHVAGVGLTEANCQEASQAHWNLHIDAWTIVFGGGAVLVGIAGLAAALITWHRTKEVGPDPPGSRVHFLSIVSLTTTPLFLAIMLMSSISVLFLSACRQS